ncbi:hypothetical protein Pmani_036067 [Petrolisthes manimaculis]|uniref:Uncharacterized protein n=1 Tax=Petrolisthes manimaculis TaxID=1843537 RepID=A0AAE1NKI0_9EUCA|nr:hypothetical protein Pmani_036067 [Petrolisthes manimaculis]
MAGLDDYCTTLLAGEDLMKHQTPDERAVEPSKIQVVQMRTKQCCIFSRPESIIGVGTWELCSEGVGNCASDTHVDSVACPVEQLRFNAPVHTTWCMECSHNTT